MFLSIIIPVYNGAKNITNCLNSIWTQELCADDYEVICVDDCSTDNTVEVLNNISKEHNNLRIIKNDINRRAGGSRNHGVLEAKGEYIVFIDSDDYFHPGSLKEVILYLKNIPLDILVCDFAREEAGNPNITLIHNFPNKSIMDGRDFMLSNSLPYAPWKYIFKRSLMVDNNVFFEENVSAEDVDWTHKLALKAKRMQYKPLLLTHYILASQSQTANEYNNIRLITERMYAGLRLKNLASYYKQDNDVSNHINNIATTFFHKALIFLMVKFGKAKTKSQIIEKYIPKELYGNKLVDFASKHSYLFAHISNITSPFLKIALILKRNIKGR